MAGSPLVAGATSASTERVPCGFWVDLLLEEIDLLPARFTGLSVGGSARCHPRAEGVGHCPRRLDRSPVFALPSP